MAYDWFLGYFMTLIQLHTLYSIEWESKMIMNDRKVSKVLKGGHRRDQFYGTIPAFSCTTEENHEKSQL
jgi:hypothetical protein